ncbi:type IV secretion system protein [Rhizorhapis suberifaciens]|uniref:Type IV secretion system protein VirB6 n=1 Tax=Rhizorhapis suberifaciens TaxID=13656 RepID=A0A840HYD9_9SPHN|nr:type IV secretion system protein [Rhizorhapis suberifaciens]MBB4642580.1 type IV secretion system protein VirB6 [Rhizorhapis suberifaciens]
MSACLPISTGPSFLTSVLTHMDCQAQSIGASGYQALANSGSPVSMALTGLLTLFIAIWGIRLLMGQIPDGGALIAFALKIGIVLMLASSWAAYRVIAYDIVFHGPAEIAGSIGGATDLAASDGLVIGLQGVDDGMLAFTALGTGRFDLGVNPNSGAEGALPLARTVISDDLAFGMGRLAFLVSTAGMLSLLWLSAGLLLALAPLFAGLLLFEGTRGAFFGWVRALAATALGALSIYVLLGVEISMLEPWLANILALRQVKIATPAAPVELLVVTLTFALMSIGSAALCGKIAFALHIPGFLPDRWRSLPSSFYSTSTTPTPRTLHEASVVSRAMIISEAVASTQRRETLMTSRRSSLGAWGPSSVTSSSTSSGGVNEGAGPTSQTYHPIRRRISITTLERRQRP